MFYYFLINNESSKEHSRSKYIILYIFLLSICIPNLTRSRMDIRLLPHMRLYASVCYAKRKILSMDKYPELSELIRLGRIEESVTTQVDKLESRREVTVRNDTDDDEDKLRVKSEVHAVSSSSRTTKRRVILRDEDDSKPNTNSKSNLCYYCGDAFCPGHASKCKAKGKKCNKCGIIGHFSKVCKKSKRISLIQDKTQSDSDDESNKNVWSLKARSIVNNIVQTVKSAIMPALTLLICNTLVSLIIDTGSEVNIVDEVTYNKLKIKPKLNTPTVNLYRYADKTPISLIGEFETRVKDQNGSFSKTKFIVVHGKAGNLISYATAVKLGLMQPIKAIKCVDEERPKSRWISKYPNVFSGKVGLLNTHQIKLHIDTRIKPVQQKLRPVPFHLRQPVEREIKTMLEEGLIEPIQGPTPWVSPIVPVPKPDGSVRICTDARAANKAISRERHLTPTIDELVVRLNGAAKFSKIDLKSGYNQLSIEPESRYITAFVTHMGVYQYKRLNFGINAAAEVFQKTIEQTLSGITNQINFSDDIFVYGRSQDEHDRTLEQVLKRLESVGLTTNEKKCEFSKDEIDFFGYHFSQDGISIQPSKIEALKLATAPKTPSEVRSLLGLANYCNRFIENLATITKPLRDLTKKSVKWEWNETHESAMKQLKEAISSKAVNYFNPEWRTELSVDASPIGLGLVLSQYNPKNPNERHIVYIASRTLSDVETRYSQVEKEALSVVWACEKAHLYLYNCEFEINTDNKAVELIFGNSNSKPKARIERWCLRLLPYKFTVKHRPGNMNIADYLSRNPLKVNDLYTQEDIAERYVNMIASSCIPRAINKREMIQATNEDETLKSLRKHLLESRKQMPRELKQFEIVASELCVTSEGLIMRGNRIVVPHKLQQRVVKLAHTGHQGIEKTKRLLRTFVWFPYMDKAAENEVKCCKKCQVNINTQRLEPLSMSKMPSMPWEELCCDFYGPLKNGKYLFVLIDDHSRYPIAKFVSSTASKQVTPILEEIFATFGVPKRLKSDNGPPFNGREFKSFTESHGVEHHRVTPLWPRANGLCERFMRNIGKVLRSTTVDGSKFEVELLNFLKDYRATPQSSTKVSPHDLLFKSKSTTSRLPVIRDNSTNDINNDSITENAIRNDKISKAKIKKYADKNLRTRESTIKVEDLVYLKYDTRTSKSQTIYDPKPYKVISINGNQVKISRAGKTLLRNSSMLKKVETKNRSKITPVLIKIENAREEKIDKSKWALVPYVNHTPDESNPELTFTPLINEMLVLNNPMRAPIEDTMPAEEMNITPDADHDDKSNDAIAVRPKRATKQPDRFGNPVSSDQRKKRGTE